MSADYGYYLPLAQSVYESVRFLTVSPRMEGMGDNQTQKKDKDGTPVWTLSALVKLPGKKQETETFSLTATPEVVAKLNTIEELAHVRLIGLAGGKYVKRGTDKTEWSFQVTGLELVKN